MPLAGERPPGVGEGLGEGEGDALLGDACICEDDVFILCPSPPFPLPVACAALSASLPFRVKTWTTRLFGRLKLLLRELGVKFKRRG